MFGGDLAAFYDKIVKWFLELVCQVYHLRRQIGRKDGYIHILYALPVIAGLCVKDGIDAPNLLLPWWALVAMNVVGLYTIGMRARHDFRRQEAAAVMWALDPGLVLSSAFAWGGRREWVDVFAVHAIVDERPHITSNRMSDNLPAHSYLFF